MTCRDVRAVIDSFLSEQLLTETNHEILRHLETCQACRVEIDARRRLRDALRTAFNRAPELQPPTAFGERLRQHLREAVPQRQRSAMLPRQWLAVAAGLVLTTALGAALLIRSVAPSDLLARDAIGDHRNCALKFRLDRTPVPLEEAAQRFDAAYHLLINSPPDDIATSNGPAQVIDRHSCAWGGRRFGHVVLQYRGRVVSLLMTANEGRAEEPTNPMPHVIGRPVDGLSVVSVSGPSHAIVLVSDLRGPDLVQLSTIVSVPLLQRAASVTLDPSTAMAWFVAGPTEPAPVTWR